MAQSHDCVKREIWLHAIMTTERKPQTQDKFILRLPDGMRDRIKVAAENNNRSMNAEIVARLEASFGVKTYGSPLDVIEDQLINRAEQEVLARVEQKMKERGIWPDDKLVDQGDRER
jgi:plasmid stability protein